VVSGQLHAVAALPSYPVQRRLGRCRSWSVHFGKGAYLVPLPEIEPWCLGYPVRLFKSFL